MNPNTLNTQTNLEEPINSNSGNQQEEQKQLVEELKNSPFHLVNGNAGWFAVMGSQRITEPYKTKKELTAYLKTWNFMLTFISTITTATVNILKHTENNVQGGTEKWQEKSTPKQEGGL